MSRKRLVYSTAIILAWFGLVIQGSRALFIDSATLVGNGITTGTVDLQISNSQNSSSTLYEDSRAGFSYDLSPGQSQERYVFLKNTSESAVPLEISAEVLIQNGTVDMYGMLALEFTPVDSEGVPNGQMVSSSFSQISTQPLNLGVTLNPGETRRILIKTSMAFVYSRQGQQLDYDLNFIGTQPLGI